MVQAAQAFTVTSRDDAEVVSIKVKGISDLRKRIVEHHKPIKQSLDAAKKVVLAQEQKLLAPLDSAESIYKSKYATWYQADQEEKRREQLRLEAEARKKDEERRLAEATELQRAGRREEANDLLEEPPPDIQVRVPEQPKVKGLATVETWKAEVVDLHKLVCYIAEDPRFMNLIGPMMVEVNALARAMKDNLKIPGLRVYKDVSVSRR
jgi:hypothetical protein